jgi:hypothetical protein
MIIQNQYMSNRSSSHSVRGDYTQLYIRFIVAGSR